jgi:hypothetical protein
MRLIIRSGGVAVKPLELDDVDQVVIAAPNGTPITVAVDIDGNVIVSRAGDQDFTRVIRELQLGEAPRLESTEYKLPR